MVTLVTLEGEAPPAFSLDPAVSLMRLGTVRSDRGTLRRLWGKVEHIPALRRAIVGTRPDVVLSFIDRVNVLVLMATLGSAIPVVVCERGATRPRWGSWPRPPTPLGTFLRLPGESTG
jgi:hypothetical protein